MESLYFHRNDVLLILQNTFEQQKLLMNDHDVMLAKDLRRQDRVGNPSFVLKAEKHEALRSSGTLPRDYGAGNTHPGSVTQAAQFDRGNDTLPSQILAMVSQRMRTDGHAGVVKVRDQAIFRCHRLQR